MRTGPFISLIAAAYRQEEKTVTVYARFLKEAGLLTSTGGRGLSAPHMTPLDAARLTIALLSTDGPAKAVERVHEFGSLPRQRFISQFDRRQVSEFWVNVKGNLEQALAYLFALEPGAGDFLSVLPTLTIDESRKRAQIRSLSGTVSFWPLNSNSAAGDDSDFEPFSGILVSRTLSAHDLAKVWLSLWIDRLQSTESNDDPRHAYFPCVLDQPSREITAIIELAKIRICESDPEWEWGTY